MGSIVDRDGNVMTEYIYNAYDDSLTVKRSADIEANVESNKREYIDNQHSKFGDLKRVASIPVVVMEKWIAEDGINYMAPEHKDALRRKLNDPDNRFMRTMPGKL